MAFSKPSRLGRDEKGKEEKGEGRAEKNSGPGIGGPGRPAAGAGDCTRGKGAAVGPRFGCCPRFPHSGPQLPGPVEIPQIGSGEEQGDEGGGEPSFLSLFFFFLSIRPIQWS